MTLPWIALGLLLSFPYISYAKRGDPARRRYVFAVGLVVAAAIYVPFALLAFDLAWLGIELVGVLLFGALAIAGYRRWPVVLALGWLLHVGWDVGLHLTVVESVAPRWYPLLCVGFDLPVALVAALAARTEGGPRPPRSQPPVSRP